MLKKYPRIHPQMIHAIVKLARFNLLFLVPFDRAPSAVDRAIFFHQKEKGFECSRKAREMWHARARAREQEQNEVCNGIQKSDCNQFLVALYSSSHIFVVGREKHPLPRAHQPLGGERCLTIQRQILYCTAGEVDTVGCVRVVGERNEN